MTAEGDVALAAQQAEDSDRAVFVTHGDVDAVWGGAQMGHFLFVSLENQDLKGGRRDPVTSESRHSSLQLGITQCGDVYSLNQTAN